MLTKFVNDIDFLAFGLSGKIQLLPYFFVMTPTVLKGTEYRRRKFCKANFTHILPTSFFPFNFVYLGINIMVYNKSIISNVGFIVCKTVNCKEVTTLIDAA